MAITDLLQPFQWGAAGARLTPEQIARQREVANALIGQGVDFSPVGHWSQGLARVANAAAGAYGNYRASKAEDANATDSQSMVARILSGMGGQQFPAAPGGDGGTAAASDVPSARVAQAFGDDDIKGGIEATAGALGIDPIDLATVISYETGGTFDPTQAGPTTQWGQHRGLIQFGEPQAEQYGVDWANPVASQLGPEGAVANYLRDTGVKPGMNLLDVYSAINAGGVGRYNASDANNGGAPGTVRDKVETQMAGHRQKAVEMFGGSAPSGGRVEASGATDPVGIAGINPAIIEALSSPYANDQVRSVAGILLKQQMEQNDPMRALDMEYRRAQIKALNAKPAVTLTDDQKEYQAAKAEGFAGSLQDWILSQRKAGATNVTTTVGEGDKFYENLDKKNAETFSALSDNGARARAKISQIDQLQTLMSRSPSGSEAALKQWLGDMGINTEGVDTLQASRALLEKMVPEQRQPGSGPMSDADIAMYRNSLPRVINQPGGNAMIFGTLKGIAEYEVRMGEIADAVADRSITPAEGRKAIRDLENPLEGYRKFLAGTGGGPTGSSPRQIQSSDEFRALPSGAEFVAPDGSIRRKP